jgi:hypothetical protein
VPCILRRLGFQVFFSRSAGQICAISSLGKFVKLSCFFGRLVGLPLTPFSQRFWTGGNGRPWLLRLFFLHSALSYQNISLPTTRS